MHMFYDSHLDSVANQCQQIALICPINTKICNWTTNYIYSKFLH